MRLAKSCYTGKVIRGHLMYKSKTEHLNERKGSSDPERFVFTHVANSYANLLEQKSVYRRKKKRKKNSPGLIWDPNMVCSICAAFSSPAPD